MKTVKTIPAVFFGSIVIYLTKYSLKILVLQIAEAEQVSAKKGDSPLFFSPLEKGDCHLF
jgi:hypothetical protein